MPNDVVIIEKKKKERQVLIAGEISTEVSKRRKCWAVE